jgi:hypothetical protein
LLNGVILILNFEIAGSLSGFIPDTNPALQLTQPLG